MEEESSTLFGVCQLTSTNDVETNFEQAKVLIDAAHELGVQFLCLPENFAFLGQDRSESYAISEFIGKSPILQKYQNLAENYSMYLSLGGFQERSQTANKVHNTHLVINDKGEIISKYRKIHLFYVSIPGGLQLDESLGTEAGNEMVITETPFGKIGLTICYDLRFPQLYSSLSKAGAQILLVPSVPFCSRTERKGHTMKFFSNSFSFPSTNYWIAFTVPTGEAHWEALLRARAIENQCYVLAAAQVGKHNAVRESYGHSMIIDPWGKVVAEAKNDKPDLITFQIDKKLISKVRTNMPVASHRKETLYEKPVVATI